MNASGPPSQTPTMRSRWAPQSGYACSKGAGHSQRGTRRQACISRAAVASELPDPGATCPRSSPRGEDGRVQGKPTQQPESDKTLAVRYHTVSETSSRVRQRGVNRWRQHSPVERGNEALKEPLSGRRSVRAGGEQWRMLVSKLSPCLQGLAAPPLTSAMRGIDSGIELKTLLPAEGRSLQVCAFALFVHIAGVRQRIDRFFIRSLLMQWAQSRRC